MPLSPSFLVSVSPIPLPTINKEEVLLSPSMVTHLGQACGNAKGHLPHSAWQLHCFWSKEKELCLWQVRSLSDCVSFHPWSHWCFPFCPWCFLFSMPVSLHMDLQRLCCQHKPWFQRVWFFLESNQTRWFYGNSRYYKPFLEYCLQNISYSYCNIFQNSLPFPLNFFTLSNFFKVTFWQTQNDPPESSFPTYVPSTASSNQSF